MTRSELIERHPAFHTLPEEWSVLSLKRLVAQKITDGPHETPEFVDTGVPFVSAEAVQGGTLNFESMRGYITLEADAKYSRKCKPRRGDILLCKAGATTGKAAFVSTDDDFNIWSPLALIRADEGRILRRLLYLQIGADLVQDQISQYANINTQPNIGMGQIENLQIAVPPLGKQRAIADFLDRKTKAIDVLIQKKERLIELLQEKRQVLITQAVTKGFNPTVPMKDSGIEWLGEIPAHWNLHRVKHLVSFITSGSRGWAEYFSDEGPIFLQSGNLDRHLGLDLSNIQHVQPPKGAEGTRTRVRRDDVLVCITGALTGNVSHVHSDVGEAYVNQHLALVRPKSTLIHPWLLAHALASDFGQHQFWVTQYGGTKQGLGLQDVRDVVLPVPPPAEQTDLLAKLETRLSALTRLRTRIDHQVSRLREYRQVLISAAVTGKIDVTKETAC